MIKNFLITGDTHGAVIERLSNLDPKQYPPEETALIILGDAGINFYLNATDRKNKQKIQKTGYLILCLRGNHEERPENLGMKLRRYVDQESQLIGNFYWEDEYPNIKYFANYGWYIIKGHTVFVIGGAYSIDKYYRILNASSHKWTGWFEDEQLTVDEMLDCEATIYDYIDSADLIEPIIVFSHTCPIQWEPRDLFLSQVNQSIVDKTMELWLEEVEKIIPWSIWLFGHYHASRLERPCVQQMYKSIEEIDDIWNRWYDKKTIEEEYWLPKSPLYYS